MKGLCHKSIEFLTEFLFQTFRNFGDSETASNSWPYFRYFQNLDLKAFPCRRDFDLKEKKGFKSVANRRPVVSRQQQKRQQLRKGSKRRAATRRPTVQQKPKAVLNKPEGQAAVGHEYSDGQTSGSDVEGVENKRKKTESV